MHAKFYYNEDTLIITSMNISEASEERNYELGVLFQRQDHPQIFEKAKIEAREIVNNSILWQANFSSPSDIKTVRNTNSKWITGELSGKCIRCGEGLDYDRYRPLCNGCYSVWVYWEDRYFPENYCHCCGKEKDGISYARPECNPVLSN
jgi:hypothetical protein